MALLAATEGRFFKVVNDTISSSPSCVTPTRRHALAPSVAQPRRPADLFRHQPVLPHGLKGSRRRGTDKPVKPMNSPVPFRPVAPALLGELLAPDVLSIAVAALSGCSTSFWFTAVQGAAHERCESIKDADERAGCKSAKDPDEEKCKKERASAAIR
jgi:hypothetical protein